MVLASLGDSSLNRAVILQPLGIAAAWERYPWNFRWALGSDNDLFPASTQF